MLALYSTFLTVLATRSLAVLNGKPATPHQFPYLVALYWKKWEDPISQLKYYCGGVIINDIFVLTSANCIRKKGQMVVKAGKHFMYRREDHEQIRFVYRHVTHRHYKPSIFPDKFIAQNDIGLLVVGDRFVFNEYVGATELPRASDYFESGSLAGWGSTSINSSYPSFSKELHYNKYLPVIDPQDCADAINVAISNNTELSLVEISRDQICSGPVDGKSSACLKDNGSAFVSQEDDKYVIIGIVSLNWLPCGTIGLPTVYTRVNAYFKWIDRVMKSVIIALKFYSPLYP